MNAELVKQKDQILYWMYDYIEDDEDDTDYSSEDVKKCDSILIEFLTSIELSDQNNDIEWVFNQVKECVLKLNNLNETCDEALIETDQHEGICELIFNTLKLYGHSIDGDMTEEWREW